MTPRIPLSSPTLLFVVSITWIACTNWAASAFLASSCCFTPTVIPGSSRATRIMTFQHPHQLPLHHRQMISSGFSFEDGEQILVSVQKPLGILLEQDSEENNNNDDAAAAPPIVVCEVTSTGSASRAGIQVGDILVAVQNASVETADLNDVLELIGNSPRVVNLRLIRAGRGRKGKEEGRDGEGSI